MKKHFILFTFVIVLILSNSVFAQNYNISGTVSCGSKAAANVSLTFIDNDDTTNQIVTTTNRAGSYQIALTVIANGTKLPSGYRLEQNYPNPFSSSTSISYKLNRQTRPVITIYDILGRKVKHFRVGHKPKGKYHIVWDGTNKLGEQVSPGIYFYRLQVNGQSFNKKMLYTPNQDNAVNFQPKINASKTLRSKPLSKNNNDPITVYTVRIENTDRSYPRIEPTEFKNITIRNDTTLNFTVEEQITVNPAIVNLDSTHQIIRGFGAANIVGWRPDMTEDEIETAFNTGAGQLGFSILRLRIQPNSTQWSSNVPTAKAAYEKGVKIIATPWTPPAYMKTNNNTVGGRLKEEFYDDYAEHLDSFVDYMEENGVPIYAVSVQNEPDIEVNYSSCDWNASEMLEFVKNNASTINTQVMAPESYNYNHSLSNPILNDQQALSNLGMIAGHIYGGGLEPYPLAREKGKEVWMTEYLINTDNPPSDIDIGWKGAMQTALSINNCMSAGMSAYVWWYIVRYYGPIADGTYNTKGEVTKKGYVMSNFARFIRPGYYRVEATEDPTKYIDITAYKDNEQVVIVAINTGPQTIEQTFTIENGTVSSVTPYVTSEYRNCSQGASIDVDDDSFSAALEPGSITTFVSE